MGAEHDSPASTAGHRLSPASGRRGLCLASLSDLTSPQVVTEYTAEELPVVLEACERMENHLTAAVVSNDAHFKQQVLAHTLNGTTYVGIRARTTGAPQNHW